MPLQEAAFRFVTPNETVYLERRIGKSQLQYSSVKLGLPTI